ncbi:MAG: type II secretion system protein [Candidatus Magasanikiibacteriota bacterium]
MKRSLIQQIFFSNKNNIGFTQHHFFLKNKIVSGLPSTIFFPKNGAGFTLVELLIVIGIMIALLSASIPIYGSLQVKSQLSETSAQLVQNLRSARENSLSRYNNSSHGVFLNSTSSPNYYVIYQGDSYVARDINYDRVYTLDDVVTIHNIDMTTTSNNIDINFSKGLGKASSIGSFSLVHVVTGTSTISVNSFGKIEE